MSCSAGGWGHKIRELTGRADIKMMLDGHVEIDETFVGGEADHANAFKNQTIVMGLKKRGDACTLR